MIFINVNRKIAQNPPQIDLTKGEPVKNPKAKLLVLIREQWKEPQNNRYHIISLMQGYIPSKQAPTF
jgi:hypothetical protein